MSWFKQVSDYIDDHFESYLSHFYPSSTQFSHHKGVRLNPSPCCGHNDCCSFSTLKPVYNCFSCGTKGNRIQVVEQVWGVEKGRSELEIWSGIRFNKESQEKMTQEESERRESKKRLQEIYNYAVLFYHLQLFGNAKENDLALKKLMGKDISNGERGHSEDTLREYKVGLSLQNYDAFENLMFTHGYTEDEMKQANKMTFIPPYNYVYPYFDKSGNVIRFNTKPFKRICMGERRPDGKYKYNCGFETYDTSKATKRAHEQETQHHMSPDGYSTGQKDEAFYYSPELKGRKKYAILVEGENDVQTLDEERKRLGAEFERDFMIVGTGGNSTEDAFKSDFLRQFDSIYAMFDNDKAGHRYLELLNDSLPDKMIYQVRYDTDFSDPDEYYRSPLENKLSLMELIDDSELVESKTVAIEREIGIRHAWNAKNRKFHIRFEIDSYNRKMAQFEGTLHIFIDGEMDSKRSGKLDNIKLQGPIGTAKMQLSTFLDEYYHDIPWEKGKPKRPLEELIDLVEHSKNYDQVIKQIAYYLYHAEDKTYERMFGVVRGKIKNDTLIAQILKEVNGYANTEIDPNALFPRINLSQFFHVKNNDAFFYFTRLVKDGDIPKLVPCLLTNKKEEIRLDLLKRKDPQSLLLIKNKYEMPFEVETAVMDPRDVSLQPYWVDKWKNGELSDEDISPARLVKEIEDFINRCYYLRETSVKVLALWIYSTYFYMLFKSGFPYLMFTGPKGTGKSTLDTIVYLLSINAKLALDMSESALYRTITFEGGTFILDEVEHLTDKKVVDSNGYAKILKGGYSDGAYVYRSNPDKANLTERFSVFGPKVISNINGIEDVIADRCLYIRTFRVPEEKLKGLEDPQEYKEEGRSFVHAITSRCVLSSLVHYQEVAKIFKEMDSLQTGNARLSQLMKPLMAMAKFVGGDYQQYVEDFYINEVKQTKQEISDNTTEGIIINLLRRISSELAEQEVDKWATQSNNHLYSHPIAYNPTRATFEVDTLHLKVLAEEQNSDIEITLSDVAKLLKAILGPDYDNKRRIRTTARIDNELLQKAMGGKEQIRVYRYTIEMKDFMGLDEWKEFRSGTVTENPMF